MFDLTPAVRAARDAESSPAYRRLKPGPGKSPIAVRSDQSERIQTAMIELVAAGGRRTATVRRLTKLARVSTATFYSLFDGTDECLVGTYVSLMDRLRAAITAATASDARRPLGHPALQALLDGLLEDPRAARLILIEVFDAGPAAITAIRTQETLLETALRESLERGGRRVPGLAVAWAVAGILHCARRLLDEAAGRISPAATLALIGWAQSRLIVCGPGRDDHASRRQAVQSFVARRPSPVVRRPPREDEADLFVKAIVRLVSAEGYWKLSIPRVSRAAGIPATHFKRSFSSLDEAYLLTVDRTVKDLFADFGRTRGNDQVGGPALDAQIAGVSTTLASAPQLAAAIFADVLAPGAAGLTRREALIDELAATCRHAVPAEDRPSPLCASASMASLWSAFARAAEGGRTELLPGQAPTNGRFFRGPAPTLNRSAGDSRPGAIALSA